MAELWALGVDMGGTLIKCAAVTRQGRILGRTRAPTRTAEGPGVAVRQIVAAAAELTAKARGRKLAAVGVGIPGILDRRTAHVGRLTNFPGWEGYPLRSTLERELGRSVVLENDANMAAIGEKWLGAGRSSRSFLFVTIGTGVGGGLFLDGRLWTGDWGWAGEVGHVKVEPEGLPCGCGSRGCLEQHASGKSIVRMAREAMRLSSSVGAPRGPGGKARRLKPRGPLWLLTGGKPERVDPEVVCRAARQGDETALSIYRQVGQYLGQTLADVVNLLDVRDFVFGGGVSNAFDVFYPYLHEELRKKVYGQSTEGIRIERSRLGEDAGVLGAARLAFDRG